ncbi:MAG: ATP-binding protein [Flavobacteriaceae bacterium]|nr:ATP-binding protein [Flavobacteriaceae bacterium]
MKKLYNPFIETGYINPTYFCDRENEAHQLIDYIHNQTNVTLFAFRRLGKTGLIKHVFYQLKKEKNIVCIYVDVFDTTNKIDFINRLATSIYNAFPVKSSLGKKIITAIQSLRPVISFDELTGMPNISLDSSLAVHQQNTLTSLFSFIDNQNIQVVFAIDEFQQILSYPEKNIEASLRTHIQALKNTSFIFCGSDQTKMHQIFNDAKRPFFASCSYMHLNTIEEKKYSKFITKMFRKYDKNIAPDAVKFICDWTMLHTFYTQKFSKEIFVGSEQNISLKNIKIIAAKLLQTQEGKFYQYRSLLTAQQWQLLKAVAKEGRLTQPNSQNFISKYKVGNASAVRKGLDSLQKKEMILHNIGVEKPYYEVYDKFLMHWLQSK